MAEEKYVPRLKTKYNNEVKQQLQDKFQYENVMMIPKFEKIVVNMGVGEAATDSKAIDGAVRDLRAITGQQPTHYPEVWRRQGEDHHRSSPRFQARPAGLRRC